MIAKAGEFKTARESDRVANATGHHASECMRSLALYARKQHRWHNINGSRLVMRWVDLLDASRFGLCHNPPTT
jgi:hypothetical protein